MDRSAILKLTILAVGTSVLHEHFGNIALVLGALGLFIWRKEALSLGSASLKDDSGAIGAALAAALLAAFCCITPPGAGDDVLRDIASSAYQFDYHRMYPNADIQQYNAYLGFDHLLAILVRIAGPAGALHLVQAAGMLAFLALFVLLGRQSTSPLRAEHYALMGLALATPLSSRIFLARPEILLTVWGLYGALATTRWRLALWVIAGAALTTGYWLAALYFPFVLLTTARFRTKVVLGALLLGWNVLFWHAASHGTYLESLSLLSSWPRHRVMEILETGNCLQLLLNPYFLALTLLAGMSCSSRRLGRQDFSILLLIGYFLLSGMVRYVAVWVGLLFMLVLPWLETRRVENLWLRAGLLFFPFYCASAAFGNAIPMSHLPSFTYPKNAYVLTGMDISTFATPFFNQGTVSVAPSMELGANTTAVQTLAAELSKGRLDCTKLRAQPFTHVVENRLTSMPSCLKLMDIKGGWREWEVVR